MKYKPLRQLQYWQGQALRSRDFNYALDYAEQLRWWHNRGSHGAFGVGYGLAVDADGTVHCGVAYDCFGRELVIPGNRKFPPAVTGAAQYLAVTWGVPSAQLAWISYAEASVTRGVLLARAKDDGSIDAVFHALRALPLSRARMSSGSTPPGNTPWEEVKNVNGVTVGLRVRIDTTSAGFTKPPFYTVSAVWTKGRNERFTPPYVVIDNPKEDGFTARLLLQGSGGQEKFEVATAIETLTLAEWSSHVIPPFAAVDPLARLLPRVSHAVEIIGPDNPVNNLTLAGPAGFNAGDSVALVNLPRNPTATHPTQAIHVADVRPFDGQVVIRREAAVTGFAAGDAARIDRVLSTSQLLLPQSPIRNLKEADRLDIVKELGTVHSVSADGLTVTLAAPAALALKQNDVAVRTSADASAEVPVLVDSQSADKLSVVLKVAIPSLSTGNAIGVTMARLGAGQPGAPVDGFVDTVTTNEVELFRTEDVLGGANGTIAIVTSVEQDVLLLNNALSIEADGTIAIGDNAAKSTITAPPGAASFITVHNPAQFSAGDAVAFVKVPTTEVAAVRTVTGLGAGTLNLNNAVAGVNTGDIVASVRFSAKSPILSLTPLTVADSSRFRPGDLVTLVTDSSVCWEIHSILAGNILKLKSGGPAVTGTLAVVSIKTVAKVVAPAAGAVAPSITIDGSAVARKGWYVAHIDSWKDVTAPLVLQVGLPDGTLPGDSIGFAALTPTQPLLQFASGVQVPAATQLIVTGKDEFSGADLQIFASVQTKAGSGPATLTFNPNAPQFSLRPEALSVVALFPKTLADDFAAYAQQKGLALYWLGCELASPAPSDCPGIRTDGTCSCQ
jgi:hypothetical protein